MTDSIGFVNTSLTNFSGFGVYNGCNTSYMDNVRVTAPGTVTVSTNNLAFQVMKGQTASNQFALTAQAGVWNFANTTSAAWLAVSPATGTVRYFIRSAWPMSRLTMALLSSTRLR